MAHITRYIVDNTINTAILNTSNHSKYEVERGEIVQKSYIVVTPCARPYGGHLEHAWLGNSLETSHVKVS